MPKYVIERELPGAGDLGDGEIQGVSQKSNEVLAAMAPRVQWQQSYVCDDRLFCIYIADDAEAVREHARRGGFPVTNVYKVNRVIDPRTGEAVAVDARGRPLDHGWTGPWFGRREHQRTEGDDMMRKLLVGAVMAAAVAVPTLAVAQHGGEFSDVGADHPFHDDIQWLAGEGITNGCSEHAFCPEDDVTRGQMAAFLHRSAEGPAAADLARANLATAAYQDVEEAEADGWGSTLGPGEGSLGCFEDPAQGGMGVHYVNGALLDDQLDVAAPEALVYELDRDAAIDGLVALEYIVPVDAWTGEEPPMLFGRPLHQHPTLPLYVLHAWIWKDNPAGVFEDFNPRVRLCPDGVPVFGE